MANNFFEWGGDPGRLIPFDTARAQDVNAMGDAIEGGFDGVEVKTNAAIKLPDGETAVALGNAAARMGKVLTFNPTTGVAEAVYAYADVATVAGIAANVTTVAGISASVTTVAGISGNVTTVAGISGNVTTVAGISADVTTVALNTANINAVAADATDIGTVAASIADVNTVADNAVDVATCATNIVDINAAASNAATATTQAGVATTQAGIATTQASNALTSANNAASSYDAFDDRYLGSKAADPTLDNDGNALLTGALYWNSVAGEMRAYSGSAWIAAYIPESAYLKHDGSVVMTGSLQIGVGLGVIFEGATDNTYETTLSGGDPTADRTITLPDETVVLAGRGANNFADSQQSRAMFIDCGYTVIDKGNSSTTTQTYDYTAGSVQTSTATGNHTIAFSNWPPTGNLGVIQVILTNGGAFTLTWPGSILWLKPDGTTTSSISTYLAALTGRTALQTSGVDQFVFWSRDAGTTVYGKLL